MGARVLNSRSYEQLFILGRSNWTYFIFKKKNSLKETPRFSLLSKCFLPWARLLPSVLATNFFPDDTLIGQAPSQGETGGAKTDGYDYVLSEPNECGTSAGWANPHSTTSKWSASTMSSLVTGLSQESTPPKNLKTRVSSMNLGSCVERLNVSWKHSIFTRR